MTRSDTEAYHIAQLEKAVDIIRRDLDRMDQSEFLKLREDLFDFCYGARVGPAMQRMMERVPVEKFNLDEFFDQMKRQRKMIPDNTVRPIVDYLKLKITAIASQPAGFVADAKITDGTLTLHAHDKLTPFKLTLDLEAMQAAELNLLLHLYGSGLTPDRFRTCPLDTCKNVFVVKAYARTDRERFCSKNCARNAATRRYREGKKKREKKAKKKGRIK